MNATSVPRLAGNRSTATCPLCQESPAANLVMHLDGEAEGNAGPTFAIIKVLHLGWFEDHGVCAACWKFYRNLALVLTASGFLDTHFRVSGRRGNATVEPKENGQGSREFKRPKA